MASYQPEGDERKGRRQHALTAVSIAFAAVALYLPTEAQESVASALRASVLQPFVLTQQTIAETRVRAVRIDELQARLDSTVAVLESGRTLEQENRQLRGLLDLRERAGPTFEPATVVRPGTQGSESMFLLDIGEEAGVQVYDPVVAAEGLVGVIREVRRNSAMAMDWTHPDFRVSAMSVEGEAFGMVEPYAGRFREEDRLLLTGTPYHTELPDSTAIVTSGRGSVYPRGILLGRVHSVQEAEGGWRRSYWLHPAVQPAEVSHVLVMTRAGGDQGEWEASDLWVPGADERAPESEFENGEGGEMDDAEGGPDSPVRGSPEGDGGDPGVEG